MAPKPAGLRGRLDYTLLAMLAVIALAYALRIYRLDYQSFWYDEGVSITMAPKGLETITRSAAADIHPPLYYYLLHFWVMMMGTSELAARYLSLLWGVLLIPVLYQIGARLFAREAGLLSAILAAIAPFLVYYSQEARTYMQTAFLGALSMYLFLRLVDRPWEGQGWSCRRLWAAYIVVSALALYSHYFAFVVLVAQNVYYALVWWFRPPISLRALFRWAAGQLAVALLYVPWLLFSYRQLFSWPSISEPLDLPNLLRHVFLVFSFGLSWDAAATPRKEAVFLALLLASGLFLATERRRPNGLKGWSFLLLYFLVPVAAMYFLSLHRPMYNPKFLLVAAPGYYMLLATGIYGARCLGERVSRRVLPQASYWLSAALAVACLLAVVYGLWRSMAAYYFDAKYARDDYRSLVRYIEANSRSQDAIVLNAPGQVEVFSYYYRGDLPVYPLPKERPIVEERTAAELQQLTDGHDRVWLVLWAVPESDPRGFIEGWLDSRLYKAVNRWFGTVRLALYIVPSAGAADQQLLDFRFGSDIALEGYSVAPQEARPGDIVQVALAWRALRAIAERYTVFVHILDSNEYIWGQRDSEPGGGGKLTTTWNPGETVLDRHGVAVLAGTPPGRYRFEVGLYQPETGARLPIYDGKGTPIGDRLLLGELEVRRPDVYPSTLEMGQPLAVDFGGVVELLGYDLAKLGHAPGEVDFRPGDILHLTLFWRAARSPDRAYLVRLRLLDGQGREAARRETPPAEGNYSTTRWEAGEVVRDQHKLPLSALQPGRYSLILEMVDAAGEKLPLGRVELGTIEVR